MPTRPPYLLIIICTAWLVWSTCFPASRRRYTSRSRRKRPGGWVGPGPPLASDVWAPSTHPVSAFPFLLGTPHSPPPTIHPRAPRPPRSSPRRRSSRTDQRRCIVAIPPSHRRKVSDNSPPSFYAVSFPSSASIHAQMSMPLRSTQRSLRFGFPCSIHRLPSPFPAANLCCLLGAVDCFHRYDFFDVDERAKRPLIFYRPIIRLRAPMFFPHRYLSWA